MKKVLFIILAIILSWLICIGMVGAVYWCFGWFEDFSIRVATGIWLILIIFKGEFNLKYDS